MSDSLRPHGLYGHGILQARILEWVAFPFSRESSQPKDRTQVSRIEGRLITSWATREAHIDQEATVRIGHGTMDWFEIGKGEGQGCILSPCLFNLMQSTSCEMPGWMKHKLESRLLGEMPITSDTQITPPYGRKWRQTEEPLDESERGEWKRWLKLNIKKTKMMASGPITSWQIDGETVRDFIFLGS